MMHVEALQWLNWIIARRLRANYHRLYELGNANKYSQASWPLPGWPELVRERGSARKGGRHSTIFVNPR